MGVAKDGSGQGLMGAARRGRFDNHLQSHQQYSEQSHQQYSEQRDTSSLMRIASGAVSGAVNTCVLLPTNDHAAANLSSLPAQH